MGTNYYHHRYVCPTCGKSDVEHIGKSSGGWAFSFHGTEQIRSWADWQEVLQRGGSIVNEYGEALTLDEFCELVEAKRSELRVPYSGYKDEWLDAEGNAFTEGDFS